MSCIGQEEHSNRGHGCVAYGAQQERISPRGGVRNLPEAAARCPTFTRKTKLGVEDTRSRALVMEAARAAAATPAGRLQSTDVRHATAGANTSRSRRAAELLRSRNGDPRARGDRQSR